ncbi:hypothetical protein ACSVDA_12255 [Cytobacillus sp. Hm23]
MWTPPQLIFSFQLFSSSSSHHPADNESSRQTKEENRTDEND